MIPRSYLYVPGDDAAKLEKATSRGADALIVDLEDAVAPAKKDEARALVTGWLSTLPATDVEIWVRVNPGDLGLQDARAVLAPRVRGLVAAKTESAEGLRVLAAEAAAAEDRLELPRGAFGLVPLLESARALLAATEIAAVPGVVRLQVGEADLAADLGFARQDDQAPWDTIRTQTVIVSAAAGIEAPVAPVSTDFRDLDGFAASTRALAARGFVGRACIHPAQVAVANEVFTPRPEDVGHARALIAAFDEAVARGVGVILGEDGRMIDEAVVRNARRTVALAR
ncbi:MULTISPECIES: CoA ester lyase [unclassified Nocardioides]|uniref:HpcH/HpaI aldolase/citrate lyase family protein n=1 Tax=unclassified Nocardioides TaxID=2615069 RepID=UPI0000571699|nr:MULTISPECIES: CoA ester lyase [unclassified Nocardioides]ABL83576.1 HpcH/HpaI aldolase [Nocardioides sp. JS614]